MTVQTYLDGNSFLHKMDERIKLLWAITFVIGLFFTQNLIELSAITIILISISIYSVGVNTTFKTLSNILIMIVVLVLCIPLTRRNHPWLITNIISYESLRYTSVLILRFISISYCSVLLFQTSRIERIIAAFIFYKMPKNFALTLTLSFRFIPFVFETMGMVEQSHKLRITNDKFSFKEKISLLKYKLISGIIVALKSATKLAMHLSHRGFGTSKYATSFVKFNKHWYNPILVILALFTPYLIYLLKKILL